MTTDALARALDGLVHGAAHRDRAEDLRWAFETLSHDASASEDDYAGARIAIRDAATGLLGAELVPLAIDPLVELAELPLAERRWVAMRVATSLDTAAAWMRDGHEHQALGHDVVRRVAAHGDRVLGWLGGPLEDPAIVIARRVPALQRALVDRLAAHPSPPAWGLLALAALPPIPPHAFESARRALDDTRAGDEFADRRVAAAILLQRDAALDETLAGRIDEVLGPAAERWRLLCARDELRGPPLADGSVSRCAGRSRGDLRGRAVHHGSPLGRSLHRAGRASRARGGCARSRRTLSAGRRPGARAR